MLVEAYYDGAWQDITSRVRAKDRITIARGMKEGDSAPPPTTCTLTLDNRDGWANPRSPDSPLYGKAGRNTPLRVWAGPDPILDDTFTRTTSDAWTGAGALPWALAGGTVGGDYDVNGTQGTQTHPSANVLHHSTVDTGQVDQRVRATFDWSAGTITGAGASAWTLGRFTDTSNYYAAVATAATTGDVSLIIVKRVGGSLTTLASTLTHAGYGGLFATYTFTVELYVERNQLWAKIWDSSNDAEPSAWNLQTVDPANALPTGTVAGVASRRETSNTNANLQFRVSRFTATPGPTRFCGEISSWQPRRAIKGDAWTQITAAGLTRRLGRGQDPILSAGTQEALENNPVALWPLDDKIDAQQARSGLLNGPTMNAQRTLVDFTDEAPPGLAGSVAPSLVSGNALVGQVSSGSSSSWNVAFWFKGLAGEQSGVTTPYIEPLFVWESGSFNIVWGFRIINEDAGQSLFVLRTVFASGTTDPFIALSNRNLLDDQWHLVQMDAFQSAGQVAAELYVDGELVGTDADAAPPTPLARVGRVESLGIETATAASALDIDHFHIAGIAIFDSAFPPEDLYQAGLGWPGELAGARFLRLCAEQDIVAVVYGDEDDTHTLGPQFSDTLLNHLQEIADTDAGLLVEIRHERGLGLVTGRGLYNQDSMLDLAFAQVAPPFEPDIDDRPIRNDVTVSRRNGSSTRVVRDGGPLNVNDPQDDPEGVGRVTTQVTLNPELDTHLPNQAGWLLHLGTLEDTRYPLVGLNLSNPALAGVVVDAAGRVDVGDRLTVSDIPDEPDDASLLVLGYTEIIAETTRSLVFNTMPESAYRVAVWDDTGSRYSSSGSTLASSTTTTATSWSVATPTGPLWTTRAGAYPLDFLVEGERVTVTAVSGASSPQTFTVTRSVNGVVKAHGAGATVGLFNVARYGL